MLYKNFLVITTLIIVRIANIAEGRRQEAEGKTLAIPIIHAFKMS